MTLAEELFRAQTVVWSLQDQIARAREMWVMDPVARAEAADKWRKEVTYGVEKPKTP